MTPLHHILFLDVETVAQHPEFDQLDPRGRSLWQQKIGFMARRDDHAWEEQDYAQSYKDKAAIYAEFGKVIVISAGIIHHGEGGPCLRIKSFYGHDEREVLMQFASILEKNFHDPNQHFLCGHNIREFDIPYLCRRMTAMQIPLPTLFNITGKKPWEVKYIADTLELWKFGDHKNYTSLDLLSHTLGLPSPKDEMDGSMVGLFYWEQNALEEIKKYCEKDVVTVAQVYLRLMNMPLLTNEQVLITN
jgi:predicted PolB exonuclease-like 3'-5' exonuclease